jgi:dTDP-4-dehydrorhamnose reductase
LTPEEVMMLADVVVLGARGSLGHIAVKILSARFNVLAVARKAAENVVAFDALSSDDQLVELLGLVRPNGLALNAIAMLASDMSTDTATGREEAILVNAIFPNRLARIAAQKGVRVVQISTDAVFPRLCGTVVEGDRIGPDDFYGLTKAAGELNEPHCITLRCSIVGPPGSEHKGGLWGWVATQKPGATIQGFVNHSWCGLTTHQLATTCANLVDETNFARVRRVSAIHHLAPNTVLSKFELVRLLACALRPDLTVEAGEAEKPVTRVLASRYSVLDALTSHFSGWTEAIGAAIEGTC